MSKDLKRRLDRLKKEKPIRVVIAPKGVDKETYKREHFPNEPDVFVIDWEDRHL